MGDIEFVVVLLAAAAVLVRIADAVHVPSPVVLVLGGVGIALIPGLPRIPLPPDVIFLVFLPPLVYSAGWSSSPRALRAVAGPLAVLALALVFATAATTALVAHAVVPGLGWAPAAVLGAALAPTDVVAATAVFRRLGAPERLRLLAEGESMLNDGTGLVIYGIAVGAATGGGLSAGGAVLEFLGNSIGGAVVGLAVAWLELAIIRRQSDVALVVLITVLGAYVAYIGAEELHASGVLAAVVASLYVSWHAPRAFDADTRLTATSFWRVLVFGLEVTLFVLLGLQLPQIVDELQHTGLSEADVVTAAAAIAIATLALRMVFAFAMGSLAGETAGERVALGWSGMRGAISLAAALGVPLAVESRPTIILIAFGVILLTLIGQGLTLPLVLRALRVEEPRRWSDEEAIARMEAAQAALDRLDELEDEGVPEERLRRLRDLYRTRFRVCQAVLDGEDPETAERSQRLADYGRLRRELIRVERETLLDLRAEGRLRQATMRQIERDLDLEEARLRA